MDLALRRVVCGTSRLGGEEKAIAVRLQPGGEPQLSVAVARGDIDVIDPVTQEQVECLVGFVFV